MRSSPSAIVRLSALVAASVAAIAGSALQAQSSPFIPDGFGREAAPVVQASALDRFEFRGITTLGSVTFATVVDTSTSKSLNLPIGETVEGLRAVMTEDGSVQLESGGQVKRLMLKEAKIVAMAVPPPPPPGAPPVPPSPPSGGGPAVAGAPISDEEARVRMQRVAEEIRRRREMRRQMLETQQQLQQRPANQ